MSEHQFRAVTSGGVRCEVFIGWKKHLEGYFLLIEVADTESEDDGLPLYSSYYEDTRLPSCPDDCLQILSDYGIALPQGLRERLERNRRDDSQNEWLRW